MPILRKTLLVPSLMALAAIAAPAAAKDKLSFAYNLDPTHDAAVWPIAAGKITSDTLDVELRPVTIPAATQAQATKQFDTFEQGILSIEQAEDQGLKVTMLGVELRYQPAPVGFGIWAKADSPIKSVEDLKGKKIATFGLRSTVFAVIRMAMKEKYHVNVALDGGDFNWVELPGPGMMAALSTGRIDAATLSHIQSYQARMSPDYKEIVNSGGDLESVFGARVITSVILGYPERVTAHPDDYRELLRMLKASSDYVAQHPQEVFDAVAKKDKIDAAFFADWFANYAEFPIAISEADIKTINREWVMARDIGMAKNPQDIRKWIWDGALKE